MKKLLLLTLTLLLSTLASWAGSYTVTYKTDGSFYNLSGSSVSGDWNASKWVSNAVGKPIVTLSSTDNGALHSGNGNISVDRTYTISVSDAYVITGYTIELTSWWGKTTVTPAAGGDAVVFNSASDKVVVTGLETKSTSFTNVGWTLPSPTITFTLEDEYTVVVNGNVPTGTTITAKGNTVTNGSKFHSAEDVAVGDVSVTYPDGAEYRSTVSVEGSTITINIIPNVEITDAEDLEDGYYVIQGVANSNTGFWYHDTSLGDSRYFRMSTTSSPDLLSYTNNFASNLKYVWKLKNGVSSFTLQNVGTGSFAPADASRNENFTGSVTANFVWDSDKAAINQTNNTYTGNGLTNATLYVHCNAPSGDMNLSYWTSGPGENKNTGTGSLVAPKFYKVDDAVIEEIIFNNIITQLQAMDFGTGVGQYSLTGEYNGYTSLANDIIDGMESYTVSNFELAEYMIDNHTLNLPTTNKFYRFNIGTKYMCNVADENVRTATTTSDDASTIFYLNASNYLIAYADGYGFNWAYCKATAPTIFNGFEFSESPTIGKYLIHALDGTGSASNRYLTINESTSKLDAGQGAWTITEVTSLPVTITSAGYATLKAPVALTIPTGVTAYTGVVNGGYMRLTPLVEKIPANTPVILKGSAGTYSFATTTSDAFEGSNELSGTIAAESVSNILTLQVIDDVIGLYTYTGSTIGGFKAYLPGASQIKSLVFVFDEADAITEVAEKAEVTEGYFDLSGRRIQKPSKGLYIVNGKKVVIK